MKRPAPFRPGELISWAIVRTVALGCLIAVLLVMKDGGLARHADEPPAGVLPVYELNVQRAPTVTDSVPNP